MVQRSRIFAHVEVTDEKTDLACVRVEEEVCVVHHLFGKRHILQANIRRPVRGLLVVFELVCEEGPNHHLHVLMCGAAKRDKLDFHKTT